jgi:hypothetical protein
MIPKYLVERSLCERIYNYGGKSWNYSITAKKVYASREKIIHATSGGGIDVVKYYFRLKSNAEKEIIVEKKCSFWIQLMIFEDKYYLETLKIPQHYIRVSILLY